VVLPVFVSAFREYRTKKGANMAFVQVDDLFGSAELIVFQKTYETSEEVLKADKPLMLAARVDASKEKPVLIAEKVALLTDILPSLIHKIHIQTSSLTWSEDRLSGLLKYCKRPKVNDEKEGQENALEGEEKGLYVPLSFALSLPGGSVAELETLQADFLWDEQSQTWAKEQLDKTSMMIECKPWQVKFAEKRKSYQPRQE